MHTPITLDLDLSEELTRFHLPVGVNNRLQHLLDKQDSGQPLTSIEQEEAQGLIDLAELLTLLKLRCESIAK